jgi:hypothetical protein
MYKRKKCQRSQNDRKHDDMPRLIGLLYFKGVIRQGTIR